MNNKGIPYELPHKHHALGHPSMPPHLNGHAHMPPHIRSSKIRLDYNEDVISRINQICGENMTEYVINQIENSPPEIKLIQAILLSIKADLSGYPQEAPVMIRFDTPFMTEQNAAIIARALQCGEVSTIMNIYNACPPEQAIIALAAAILKHPEGEA